MRFFLIGVLSPLLIAAAPPTDAETTKDVRCLVAVSSLAGSEDAAAKYAAVVGAQYFLGRIDGRRPDFDLEAAIKAEASQMTDAEIRTLLVSCGGLIKSRGEALEAIGKAIQATESQSSSSS
jgi:hypothetical protein